MNNKKGGVGAKILLVLILMIASAVGGAYGYRVLDGKMAVSDAKKDVEAVRISDYESPESTEVQGLIDNINKDLGTATTRKEVYDLMEDFNSEIAKVQTKAQKELEAARKEAEEARKGNNNNNNYNNGGNNSNNNYSNDNNYNNGGNDVNYNNDGSNNYNGYDDNNSYNDSGSNNNNSGNGSGSLSEDEQDSGSTAITNDDDTSGRSGLLGSLLGRNTND